MYWVGPALGAGGVRSAMVSIRNFANGPLFTSPVFSNRSLRMDRIQWVGFDLDYTLANYKNPEYDAMTYDLLVDALVEGKAYPKAIKDLHFDPNFLIRGLVVDKELGNVLKLDRFASILVCYHGTTRLAKKELARIYPSLRVASEQLGTARFEILNTTYHLAYSSLWVDLIDYYEKNKKKINYKNLWVEIKKACDDIHDFSSGILKQKTLQELSTYVENDIHLSLTLNRLISDGKKLFLLTNSPWKYVDGVMSWLLNDKLPSHKSWQDYFELIIVDANKPLFFNGTSPFHQILENGEILYQDPVTSLNNAKTYSGGNLHHLNRDFNITAGNDVLYVGDHIFSDVIVSKKKHAWRTLLIIPELQHELSKQNSYSNIFLDLVETHKHKSLLSSDDLNQSQLLKNRIREKTQLLDQNYNKYFGSIFRSGLHQSFFSMQVGRYADLYSNSVSSLFQYPKHHTFQPPFYYLPHESSLPEQ
eukprot:TRINITY_DN8214_c0_g1_i1.p1 TRINITY_DN8214_c0_g1~~TRINITY_DN8214_c0_g1_i1.p1  ORF type:complete len:475 (-),score=88.66 TRINITY_DN8214_c0_g1_i1:95-1519(-)